MLYPSELKLSLCTDAISLYYYTAFTVLIVHYPRKCNSNRSNSFLDRPNMTTIVSETLTPKEGSHVSINCSATAVPSAMYKFYQLINGLISEISSSTSGNTGVLEINRITAFDKIYQRTYKCVPYNLLGEGPSKNITFNVQGKFLFIH